MTKTTMEALLSWAFVHELPKGGGVDGLAGGGSAWSAITGYGQLGTLVDTSMPADWRPPFILEQGEPDADAVAIGRAVAELGAADIVIPDGWNPLGDWQNETERALGLERADAVAARVRLKGGRAGRELVAMLVAHAILGTAPDWRMDEPRLRLVSRGGKPAWFVKKAMKDAFGREFVIEVDGTNPKHRGHPVRGAYRKHELADDPTAGILSRLDWQLRVAALDLLEYRLDGVLARREIARAKRDARPWGGPDCGAARVVLGVNKGAVDTKRVA